MPVTDAVLAQDLEHGRLVASVVDCIVGSDVLARPHACLADVLQHFYLVQNFIVTFVVVLGGLLILFEVELGDRQLMQILIRLLLNDLLVDGAPIAFVGFVGHRIVFLHPEATNVFLLLYFLLVELGLDYLVV